MQKPIQIVNEAGEYIGLAEHPGTAKQKSQIRLISRVILRNNQGQFLLQKRAADTIAWPGFWDTTAAGHVDEGENSDQAAYRELSEEVGITGVSLCHERELYHANPTDNDGSTNRMYSHIYSGLFNGDASMLTLEPSEVSEVRWFSLEEINVLLQDSEPSVTDGVRVIFEGLI